MWDARENYWSGHEWNVLNPWQPTENEIQNTNFPKSKWADGARWYNENDGIYGVEKYYDKELSGKTGITTGLRKIPKALQGIMKLGNIKKSEDRKEEEGDNLVLTIDSFLQDALNNELEFRICWTENLTEHFMNMMRLLQWEF